MERINHKIRVRRQRRGLGFDDAARFVRIAAISALRAEGVGVPSRVDVMLTNDTGIREINREYRSIDAATDVLSFPQFLLNPGNFGLTQKDADLETGTVFLGDIVISLPRVMAQAEEYGTGNEREIKYLTVHSVLHLLGYDHVDDKDGQRKMRERERVIMRSMGYEE